MMYTVALLLVAVVVYLNYFFKRRRLYKYTANIDGPPSLPFVGSIWYLSGGTKNAANNIVALTKKYKSPWKIWLGGEVFIIVTDPEDAEVIFNNCLEKATGYKFVKVLLGEGLFTGCVPKWKRHRKIISTTFNLQILNSYVDAFSENSGILVDRLRKHVGKGVFDVYPLLAEYSLEVTCETIMGTQMGNTQCRNYVSTLADAMNIIYTRILHFWLQPDFVWKMTSYNKQLNEMCDSLKKFVTNIAMEKQAKYDEETNLWEERRRKGFLDHLIELCSSSNEFTDAEMIEEAQNIVTASGDSLGSTPSFVLMMLAMHPWVQDKVYEELESIFGDSDRNITKDDVTQMVYLEAVIKETLRIFPLTTVVGRHIDKDVRIKSYDIPGGCDCFVGILYIHRNPKIWKDPLKFDPDRFSPEEVAKRHPYSYLPFSGGPRNCLGAKYAMMAMKTAIASIVRNFRLWTDLKEVSQIESVPGLVYKSAVGYRVAFEERTE